jgi:3D (Asp-Asp-Asp) domain-containing protein
MQDKRRGYKMKKGKSRLKIYKRNKRLKKALFIGLIIDCLLWAWVFQSIKQLNKNNLQLAIIQKTIIKEVEAKTDYKIGLVTAYSCNGLETQADILMNCPSLLNGKPKTANGTGPIANKTMACDVSNMGKSFQIGNLGVFTCTDTGGAIKGKTRFDLYLENVEAARQFGKQHLIIKEI